MTRIFLALLCMGIGGFAQAADEWVFYTEAGGSEAELTIHYAEKEEYADGGISKLSISCSRDSFSTWYYVKLEIKNFTTHLVNQYLLQNGDTAQITVAFFSDTSTSTHDWEAYPEGGFGFTKWLEAGGEQRILFNVLKENYFVRAEVKDVSGILPVEMNQHTFSLAGSFEAIQQLEAACRPLGR